MCKNVPNTRLRSRRCMHKFCAKHAETPKARFHGRKTETTGRIRPGRCLSEFQRLSQYGPVLTVVSGLSAGVNRQMSDLAFSALRKGRCRHRHSLGRETWQNWVYGRSVVVHEERAFVRPDQSEAAD